MNIVTPFVLLGILILAVGLLKAGLRISRSRTEAEEEGREHQ
ncbi:hypothetical protein PV726_34800 [Streptomyces europaeiscabiei]|nr:hypothetical protein [Streptomyces europaeiscabiei]MDX3695418.1 hypothetical protein [Streptomyces europaeiscabiei]